MEHPETIISANSHIVGNIKGDENLKVDGKIEGHLALTKNLIVSEDGIVSAEAHVNAATIYGTFVGKVLATEYIVIGERGRVVADLSAPRIVLSEGAAFRGNIDMGDLDVPRAKSSTIPASIPTPSSTPGTGAKSNVSSKASATTAAPKPAAPPKRIAFSTTTTHKPSPDIASSAATKPAIPKPPTTLGKKTRGKQK